MADFQVQIEEFRQILTPEINEYSTDGDILRFLRARKFDFNAAKEMITKWYRWRHTELSNMDGESVTPHNIIEKIHFSNNNLANHPMKHLLPCALFGEDNEGRPIYWEKSGQISSNMSQIKSHFELSQLLLFHIHLQELNTLRLRHQSHKHHPTSSSSSSSILPISQWVIVFDLSGVSMMLDFTAISYIKQILQINQWNYPERLYKLFMINAPWFFSTLYAIFSPFIDPVTAEKIVVLNSSSTLPTLLQHMPASSIPKEIGGEGNVTFLYTYELEQDPTTNATNQKEIEKPSTDCTTSSSSSSSSSSLLSSSVSSERDSVENEGDEERVGEGQGDKKKPQESTSTSLPSSSPPSQTLTVSVGWGGSWGEESGVSDKQVSCYLKMKKSEQNF